jgi:hypothetical protein
VKIQSCVGAIKLIMRSVVLAVPFLLVSLSLCHAQNFDAYQTILPQGVIPKDFTERTAVKVATEITQVTGPNARQRKAKKKFVLESTFSMDDFLASGNVLFNDDVSLYINSVLQEILKPYPDLKKQVRVYTVKSSSVNAFTTNNGLIFVNLGLLVRLKNEAQIAFVLSHEVVHFQKKHVINAYVNNIEIDQGRGDYRKLKLSEKGFSKSTYAKELETEADLEGFGIYLKSGYEKDSVDGIFDVLKFADYPLSWAAFRKEVYESNDYKFPDSLTLENAKNIVIDENYDDSRSSHPNISKRREGILAKMRNEKGGTQYKISETRFTMVRKIARFELCRQFLLDHRYIESLALATSLQQEEPASSYLKETIAKSYYGLALQSLRDELNFNPERWSGETEKIIHFISKQSPYELAVLALRQLYFCQEASPDNMEISLMLKHLTGAFSQENDGVQKNFMRSVKDTPNKNLAYAYTQYAFLDFANPAAFFDMFDNNIKTKKDDVVKRRRKKKRTMTKSPNIDRVVIVNPMYKKIDIRKKQKIRHIEAEEVLMNIDEKIYDAASKLGMKTDIINPNTMTSGQVSQMQSNTILNDWIAEQMLSERESISPIYNEMIALTNKHKTDHFMWMGCIATKAGRPYKGYYVLGALALPSIAPWMVRRLFMSKSRTLYFALTFNVKTQQLALIDLRGIEMKDSKSLLQSNIYYTLFRLRK